MPMLRNPRHEAFAQSLARGVSRLDAHAAAGYKSDVSGANALAIKPQIAERVDEIRRELSGDAVARVSDVFHPNDVTPEWLMTEFYKQVVIGRDVGDMQSSNKALEMIGKLAGIIERPRAGRPPRDQFPEVPTLRRETKDIQETVGLLEQIDHDA